MRSENSTSSARVCDSFTPKSPADTHLTTLPAAILDRDVDVTAADLGRDGSAWRHFVGSLAARGDDLVDSLLSPFDVPPRHPIDLAAFGLRGIWPARLTNAVLFREPRARALFAGVAAHAVLPLTSPATAGYGLVLAAVAHSAGWPVAVGGSQAVADALTRRLESLGGEVVTGTPVNKPVSTALEPGCRTQRHATPSGSNRRRCAARALSAEALEMAIWSRGFQG